MKHKLLNIKKLAVVFGAFAPMHTGHVDLITKYEGRSWDA